MCGLEQAQLKTGDSERTPGVTGELCVRTYRRNSPEKGCVGPEERCGNGCELEQLLPSCSSPGQAICVTSFPKRRRNVM